MKFLLIATLALSTAAYAQSKMEKKATTTTTTEHSTEHAHVEGKGDHAHDSAHHAEGTTMTKKEKTMHKKK